MYTPGERLETSCGSLAYSAPEILLGDPYDAPAVDIWSIGVLLFMLVCGKLPFQEAHNSPHTHKQAGQTIKRNNLRQTNQRR